MRDYAKVSPQFWIGSTGRRIRKGGQEAQIVAMYLLTCPSSSMIGMYYLPVATIAHDTGLSIEGACKGLKGAIEAEFCSYDDESGVVWVHEMARYQIGDQLSVGDKRCDGVQNDYDKMMENPFLSAFYERYHRAFNMKRRREYTVIDTSPLEAPSKALRSQDQETEQKTEKETDQETEQDSRENHSPSKNARRRVQQDFAPSVGKTRQVIEHANGHEEPQNGHALAKLNGGTAVQAEDTLNGTINGKTIGSRAWDAYAMAYFERYGTEPVRNARTNSQLAQLAKRLPADEICEVVCWYVRSSNAFYVRDSHGLGLLLRDCEGLRTQWATNSRMTSTEARQMDEHESTYESVRWVRANLDRLRRLRAEGKI